MEGKLEVGLLELQSGWTGFALVGHSGTLGSEEAVLIGGAGMAHFAFKLGLLTVL